MYVGSDGKLHDARNEEDMIKAVEKLNQMYNEGLILQKFDEDKATGAVDDTEHRKDLLKGNRGFATYDYNQTTTILNKQIATGKNAQNPLKDKYTPLLGSTLPAVAKWNGSDEYSFFTESWRSVKTEGWFISGAVAKDEAKLTNALKLFDYFFSEEGNRLMSYGPDEYLEHDDKGEIVYIDYQGKKVPQLSKETKEELANYAAGNYTNYYRYWLGATLPVGYVKEQGMEYQTVVDVAKPSLDNVNNAIALGVLKHVNFKADNEDKFYNIVPTSFAYNQGESNQITSNFNGLNDYINNTKGKNNTWTYIVEKGYGANDKGKETPANREAYFAKLKELNIKDYLSINQTAYDRQVDFMTKNAKKQNAFIVTKEDFAE